MEWHTVFIAKLELWLALKGGGNFVPFPHWDPDTPIPAEINRGNHNPNPVVPFPNNLRPALIVDIAGIQPRLVAASAAMTG